MKTPLSDTRSPQEIFRKASTTYYYSSIFLPRKIRDAVFDLYAFVRIADDFVDALPQQAESFHAFAKETRSALDGSPTTHPHIARLIDLVRKYSLKKEWIHDFLNAMESDLHVKTYETYSQLKTYMYGSAEVVGLCLCNIFGLPPESHVYAQSQGEAMQILNFIRDIAEDQKMGRHYIPIEDCASFQTSLTPTASQIPRFTQLILFELKRFREAQNTARAGYHYLPKRIRFVVQTAADMHSWTADQIEKNPHVVLHTKIKPSKLLVIKRACINACTVLFQA